MTELQIFIGLVQYMTQFIPYLSERTQPLRALLHNNAEWQCTSSHEQSIKKLKDLFHDDLTYLRYFYPNFPSVFEVGSSLNGTGVYLLQNGKPVALASKSLSDSEKRYANIERRFLAVVFGCERFHTCICGTPVSVKSDHKPL